jgi:hypothetical protein
MQSNGYYGWARIERRFSNLGYFIWNHDILIVPYVFNQNTIFNHKIIHPFSSQCKSEVRISPLPTVINPGLSKWENALFDIYLWKFSIGIA